MALQGKTIAVVLPAYNAATTLKRTYAEIPHNLVVHILLVDDSSQDETVLDARELGITDFVHSSNRGYGANQKTCNTEAL